MTFDVRRIPIIGNDIYQVGQVIDLVDGTCQPDPYISVYAFFANVPRLVWSLVKPDPVDFLTEKFGTGHKRKRKRKFRVGKVDLPTSFTGKGLGWATWRGLQLTQRIGWYFLVIDATTDFLVNWTSMAYLYSGCPVPEARFCNRARTVPVERAWPNVNTVFDFPTLQGQSGMTSENSVINGIFNGPKQASCSVTFLPPLSGTAAIWTNMRLRRRYPTISGKEDNWPLSGGQLQPDGSRTYSTAIRDYNVLDPAARWTVEGLKIGGSRYRFASGNFSASGLQQPGIFEDP